VQPLAARARSMTRRARIRRTPAARRTQVKALQKELKSAVADRTVAKAAIAFATRVMTSTRRLRAIGDDEEPARVKRPAGKRKAVAARSAARRRRA